MESAEPWHELAHRQQMTMLVHSGQRRAALAQYEACHQILAAEFGVKPMPETVALYEQIRDLGGDPTSHSPQSPPSILAETKPLRVDWGQIPKSTFFYGRRAELAQLQQWLLTEHCRLVGILGLGGQGKTALAAELARSLHKPRPDMRLGTEDAQTLSDIDLPFECIIWRSLINAPPLTLIMQNWCAFLSKAETTDLPHQLDALFSLLLDLLRQRRALLILDNMERFCKPVKTLANFGRATKRSANCSNKLPMVNTKVVCS